MCKLDCLYFKYFKHCLNKKKKKPLTTNMFVHMYMIKLSRVLWFLLSDTIFFFVNLQGILHSMK